MQLKRRVNELITFVCKYNVLVLFQQFENSVAFAKQWHWVLSGGKEEYQDDVTSVDVDLQIEGNGGCTIGLCS